MLISLSVAPEAAPTSREIQSIYFDSVSTFRTPAMVEGDTIAIFLRRNNATTIVSGDCDLGTLREASANLDTHTVALFTYKATAASLGIDVTLSGTFGVTCINVGSYDYDVSGVKTVESSGNRDFSTVTTTADNALVFYQSSQRASRSVAYTAEPSTVFDLPSKSICVDGGTDTSRTYIIYTREQATAGLSTAETEAETTFSRSTMLSAAFIPATVGTSLYAPEVYRADSNGTGKARSSTVTTFDVGRTGISVTLSASRKVGNYISGNDGAGDIWVLDEGSGVTVNSYTPAYTTSPRTKNGAMVNVPAMTESVSGTYVQGLDGLGTNSPAFNVSAQATVPIALSAGDTLIIANADSDTLSGDSYIEHYAVITVVGAVPWDDEFRPPYTWPTALGSKPTHRYSDITLGNLPSLTAQARPPQVETTRQVNQRFLFDPVVMWRRYALKGRNHKPTYSRDLLIQERDAHALCSSSLSAASKRELLIPIIQRGIDNYGVFRHGLGQGFTDLYESDGGHNAGRFGPIVFAGKMLGDTDMLNIQTNHPNTWQENDQTTFTTQAMVDFTQAGGWTDNLDFDEPYVQGMVDGNSLAYPMPEWLGDVSDGSSQYNAYWANTPSYYRLNGNHQAHQGQTLLFGSTVQTEWGHDAFWAYEARHRSIENYGTDPWILAGGGVSRYTMVGGAPAGSFNADTSEWSERMWDAHYVGTVYDYPWTP